MFNGIGWSHCIPTLGMSSRLIFARNNRCTVYTVYSQKDSSTPPFKFDVVCVGRREAHRNPASGAESWETREALG